MEFHPAGSFGDGGKTLPGKAAQRRRAGRGLGVARRGRLIWFVLIPRRALRLEQREPRPPPTIRPPQPLGRDDVVHPSHHPGRPARRRCRRAAHRTLAHAAVRRCGVAPVVRWAAGGAAGGPAAGGGVGVGAGCLTVGVRSSVFAAPPAAVQRRAVAVMGRTTVDELSCIRAVWPPFERLVGLRGRKMYASIDERLGTYTVCTPVRADDHPELLGLDVGTLPAGRYLRGRLVGEPPGVYGLIADGMTQLKAMTTADEIRPLVEFYRRHDQIELWLPIPLTIDCHPRSRRPSHSHRRGRTGRLTDGGHDNPCLCRCWVRPAGVAGVVGRDRGPGGYWRTSAVSAGWSRLAGR